MPVKTKRTISRRGLPLDRMNDREAAVLEQAAVCMEDALYDFSVDGGAQGDILFGTRLPAGAVITAVYSDEQTALTSGGAATLQLKAGSTALTAAEAFDTGFAAVSAHTDEVPLKLSAESELKLTIADADLTAGKVRFSVHYYVSE